MASMKDSAVFANKRISPRKRVLHPVVSAIVSFLIPGAAQAINGQALKGGLILIFWYINQYLVSLSIPVLSTVLVILHYVLMVVASSDAYFIATRMKVGEEVRTWSILFFNIEPPTDAAAGVRNKTGERTLITNVTVVDGTGASGFTADVLITGDYISHIRPHIDRKEKEYTIVNGSDRILVPGFVNPCCGSEGSTFCDAENTFAVRQGFTTEILGQNGQSFAPVRTEQEALGLGCFAAVHGAADNKKTFSNTGEFLMALDRLPSLNRYESMIGYGTLRTAMMGLTDAAPTEQQLKSLNNRVSSSMAAGAKGLSFGLGYAPCCWCSDEELISVMEMAEAYDAHVSIQLPFGEGTLMPSLERAALLARKSGANVLVTNVHAMGADRELGSAVCEKIRAWQASGIRISLAVTGLPVALVGLGGMIDTKRWLPGGWASFSEALNGPEQKTVLAEILSGLDAMGGPGAVSIAYLGKDDETTFLNQPLDGMARDCECTLEELLLDLIRDNDGLVTFSVRTDDCGFAAKLLQLPDTVLCTDSQQAGVTDYTLPHFLGRYVCKEKVLTMEDAVHRSTMAISSRYALYDRGLIREGMTADLVLLNPENFPAEIGEDMKRGVSKVWVSGALQYDSDPSITLNKNAPKTKMLGISMGR